MVGRLALVATLALGEVAARADPGPVAVALEWKAADGCAGAARLRAEVKDRVRRNAVVDGGPADVVIRGESRREPGRWAASIQVVARRGGAELGVRELASEAAGCGELDRAVVLVLAMMVDSSIVDEAAAPPQMFDAEEPPSTARLPRTPEWRGALAIAGMAEVGRLPGVPLGVELAVQIEPPSLWPVELAVSAWQEASLETGDGGSTFRHLSAALLGCPLRARHLALCGGGQVGVIEAEGFGFVDNRSERELVADVRLEARGELPVAPGWFLRVAAAAWIPLARPRFSFESSGGAVEPLFSPAPVSGVGQIGVGTRFR